MIDDQSMRFKVAMSRRVSLSGGFTLVELMVALAIASVLLLALTAMFVGTSMSRNELDKSSRQIEGGRYAVQVLSDELHHAGWFGVLANAPTLPGSVTSLPDPCSNTLATVQNSIGLPLQGYAGGASAPLSCLNAASGYKPNTAVVVVRRADTSIAATAPTSPYFNMQTSGCAGDSIAYVFDSYANAGNFTLHSNSSPGCLPLISAPTAKITPVYIRIFYISTCSQSDCTASGADSVPTLKRIDLTATGTTAPVAIIDGIENMQFEYGIDTAGSDGTPDSYTSTPTFSAGGGQWINVMAVRVHLLARNIDTTPGYSDVKTYTLGATTFTPSGSETSYRRHAYSVLVRLNNPSGRRECSTC
jgi:type IV pilus assembly protein PilW